MNGDVKLIIGELKANNTTIFKALDKMNNRLDCIEKTLSRYVIIVEILLTQSITFY